jgi:hypothetical protein
MGYAALDETLDTDTADPHTPSKPASAAPDPAAAASDGA